MSEVPAPAQRAVEPGEAPPGGSPDTIVAVGAPASSRGFFLLVFGATWIFWIPAAWTGEGLASPAARWLAYAGAFGPALVAIWLLRRRFDAAAREDYWSRLVQVPRSRLWWLLAALSVYPVVTGLAVQCVTLVTGVVPSADAAQRLLADPGSVVPFVLWIALLGPLPEELAWRGIALDPLQGRFGALRGSVVLGLAWAIWHVPLFFVAGSYQHALGVPGPGFWSYGATVVAVSVLLAWIYNNTGRSLLAVVLAHTVMNLTGALVPASAGTELVRAVLLWVVVGAIGWAWGPATLASWRWWADPRRSARR